MKIKIFVLCLIILFAKQVFCEEKSAVQDEQNGYFAGLVLFNGLRVRSENTADSRVIGYYSKNNRIRIIGHSENKENIEGIEDYWYEIKYSEKYSGWIFGGFIIAEEKIEEAEGSVNAYTVNVREFFGHGNKIIEQIDPKEIFKLISRTDKKMQVNEDEDYWYKVQLSNGKVGWIFGSLLVAKELVTEEKEIYQEEMPDVKPQN